MENIKCFYFIIEIRLCFENIFIQINNDYPFSKLHRVNWNIWNKNLIHSKHFFEWIEKRRFAIFPSDFRTISCGWRLFRPDLTRIYIDPKKTPRLIDFPIIRFISISCLLTPQPEACPPEVTATGNGLLAQTAITRTASVAKTRVKDGKAGRRFSRSRLSWTMRSDKRVFVIHVKYFRPPKLLLCTSIIHLYKRIFGNLKRNVSMKLKIGWLKFIGR